MSPWQLVNTTETQTVNEHCQTDSTEASTIAKPQLFGPRGLSGILDYPDFLSGPNLVMNIY